MKPTINDIARIAGVSIATVSRVLNGTKPVSRELSEKVMKAVKEAEYTPNSIARSLVLKKTNLIGVIIPNVSQPFHGLALSGIEEVASRNGYSVIICNVFDRPRKELNYFKILEDKQVDGIILMHESTNAEVVNFINATKIPIVLASVIIKGVKLPRVGIDDFKASYDAVKYLLDSGHEYIAMLSGNGISAGVSRYRGYCAALKEKGLDVNPSNLREGKLNIQSGYREMAEFLKLNPRPTALFAVSDEMAVGAVNCILDNGLKVPKDISVVGFDDIELASVFRPSLTTIKQPIKNIGMRATEMLIKKINKESRGLNEIVLKHELVVRESSAQKQVIHRG